MYRKALSLVVVALLATLVTTLPPAPAEAQAGCPTPTVSSSHAPYGNFGPHLAFDGKWATFFYSRHNHWQYLQVDYGCVGTFSGMRRLMTLGFGSTPNRGPKGEAVSYSVDGVTWTKVQASRSTGWENYVSYRPDAWHSVDYGWSDELRLNVPVAARYVRFNWYGNNDFVHEVDVDFARPPATPPLRVRLTCDTGIVACQASASGGAGYTFTWTPRSNATIGTTTTRGSVSSIVGTCQPGRSYSVGVTVRDSAGRSKTANASRSCLGIPL